MRAIADELAEMIRIDIRQARAEADNPLSFLSDAYHALFRILIHNPDYLRMLARNRDILRGFLFQGGPVQRIIEELENDLVREIERGHFPPHPVRVSTVMMVAAGFEAIVLLAHDENFDPRRLADYLGLLFQGGINRVSQELKRDSELRIPGSGG